MVDKIAKGLDLVLQYINSISAHDWYVFGVLVASGVGASVAVAVINYRHQWKTAEKFVKHLTLYILGLVTAAVTVADFYVTNSANFTGFLGSAGPAIFTVAIAFHRFGGDKMYKSVAESLGAWANNRALPKPSIFTTPLKNPNPVPAEPPADSMFS